MECYPQWIIFCTEAFIRMDIVLTHTKDQHTIRAFEKEPQKYIQSQSRSIDVIIARHLEPTFVVFTSACTKCHYWHNPSASIIIFRNLLYLRLEMPDNDDKKKKSRVPNTSPQTNQEKNSPKEHCKCKWCHEHCIIM